ncbi:MAG: heavy metal translocating P-type ATPase [Pseudomonadota bacterium]
MTRCFHCHEPVPEGIDITVEIAGEPRAMCCQGCAAVAGLISTSGLAQFYKLRTEPADKPDENSRRWDVFDREQIRDAVTDPLPDGSRELLCAVPNVKCAACSWLIESVLGDLPGVVELSVNPATARLRAVYRDPLALSEFLARLDSLGYRPQPLTPDAVLSAQRAERSSALRRIVVAGLGMMQVMMYAIALYAGYFEGMDNATRDFFRLFSAIVATPVVWYAGWPFFAGAWRGLRTLRPGMDLPVSLAIGGAYLASAWNTFTGGREVYFDSAVMFIFFLSLARWVEMRLRHQAFELGYAAGEELPQHALRWTGERWEPVALAELTPGDRIRVAAGETVPADGVLLAAAAQVDESLLTGESRPVPKHHGDELIAGSLLLDETIELELVRTGRDTLLSSIRRLLERARATRPRQLAAADRLAGFLVIGILVVAGATAVFWSQVAPERAFEIALAVLVITCPCALSLATPSALSAATTALLRRGILVVNTSALETLARVSRVFLDKTGTLTTGEMSVFRCDLEPGTDIDETEAHAIAAALERGFSHPIAAAFRPFDDQRETGRVRNEPGQGIEGTVDGTKWRLGRAGFACWQASQSMIDDAQGIVVLANEQGPVARFEFTETPRADADQTLRALDVPVTLLSGDAPEPVNALARQLGIDEAFDRQSPADKLLRVRKAQDEGGTVAMVGDGSNDAPVLAGADVSIALGKGSAMAGRQADVLLLGERLGAVAEAIDTARQTRRVVRQNLTWALGYNLLAVPAAAAGLIPPWAAAIGMSLSSLFVVLNSLRLSRRSQEDATASTSTRFAEAT